MEVYQDRLYIVGGFDEVDGLLANHVASYYLPPNCNYYPTPIIVLDTVQGEAHNPLQFNHASIVTPGDSITSFEWDFGDGTTVEGPHVTHSYANQGVYTVELTITNSAGCTFSTTERIEIAEWSGWQEHPTDETNFRIYPNPAKQYIIVEGPENNSATLHLYNAAGSLIGTHSAPSMPARVDLPQTAKGVIHYRLQGKNGQSATGTLIVAE